MKKIALAAAMLAVLTIGSTPTGAGERVAPKPTSFDCCW